MDDFNTTDDTELTLIPGTVRIFIDLYFNGVLLTCLSAIGTTCNVLNIVVFVTHTIKDTGTLPLLALAASDLGQTVFLCINGLSLIIKGLAPPLTIDPSAISVVVAAWPRTMFVDISVMIHMYLSVERAVCVALPFRCRHLLGKTQTTCLLCFFFLFGLACYVPVYANLSLVWQWIPSRNASMLTWGLSSGYKDAELFVSVFNSVGLTSVGQVVVMTSTCVLVTALHRSLAFQETSTFGFNPELKALTNGTRSGSVVRNKRLTKMVLLISVMFLLCNAPTVVSVYAIIFIPGLNTQRAYGNIAYLFYCLVFLCGGIQACVTIFIYYRMSTKFKGTFQKLFRNV